MTEVSLPNGVFINWTDTYSQSKPLSPEIAEILANHLEWLSDRKRGKKANLNYVDMSGANLRGANLSGADLSSADLTGANLTGADLTDADLTDAVGLE